MFRTPRRWLLLIRLLCSSCRLGQPECVCCCLIETVWRTDEKREPVKRIYSCKKKMQNGLFFFCYCFNSWSLLRGGAPFLEKKSGESNPPPPITTTGRGFECPPLSFLLLSLGVFEWAPASFPFQKGSVCCRDAYRGPRLMQGSLV